MDEIQARRCAAAALKRNIKPVRHEITPTKIKRPYVEALFRKQKDFIRDPAKGKSALCSRRAGKTWSIGAYLLQEAEDYPGSFNPYVTLTRKSAKRILWNRLKWFDKTYRLGIHFDNAELIASLENGSQIFLTGADNESEIEKLRGVPYRLAAIDEPGSFGPYLGALIEDVLEPGMLDYDGTVALIGTPNAACTGFFHDITTGKVDGYSVHKWNVLDNPFVPIVKTPDVADAATWLARYREKKGWSETHPVYMREWLGRWVRSMDSLVYRFNETKNIAGGAVSRNSNYVLGVDLGTKDAFAMVVWAFSDETPKLRAVDAFKKSGLDVTGMANYIKEFQYRYSPVSTVGDTGGLGKAIIMEMNARHGLNIRAAEKKSKADYIELMNSDFERGIIEIDPKLKHYIDELTVLQWDEDRRREDERYENNLCDAGLYGWRECQHWTYEEKAAQPSPDGQARVDEFFDEQARQIEEQKQEEWSDFTERYGND